MIDSQENNCKQKLEIPPDDQIELSVAGLHLALWREVDVPRPEVISALPEKLPLSLGDSVLDLGCGAGMFTLLALSQGANVLATDINPRALAALRYNISLNNLDSSLLQARLGPMLEPLRPDEKFDLVIANLPQTPCPTELSMAENFRQTKWGGTDGLRLYQELFDKVENHLKPNGCILMLHIGWLNWKVLEQLLSNRGYQLNTIGNGLREFNWQEYDRYAPGLAAEYRLRIEQKRAQPISNSNGKLYFPFRFLHAKKSDAATLITGHRNLEQQISNCVNPQKLLVVADDFGQSDGIDQATINSINLGCVSIASLMPSSVNARSILLANSPPQGPRMPLGIHLTLSDSAFFPLSKDPSPLTDKNGRFLPKSKAIRLLTAARSEAGLGNTLELEESVYRELRAQLELFLQYQLVPLHVCGHHHIHVLPIVRTTLQRVFDDLNLRPCIIRSYLPQHFPAQQPFNNLLAQYVIDAEEYYYLRGWKITHCIGKSWMQNPDRETLLRDLKCLLQDSDTSSSGQFAPPIEYYELMTHLATPEVSEKLTLRRGQEAIALANLTKDNFFSVNGWKIINPNDLFDIPAAIGQ